MVTPSTSRFALLTLDDDGDTAKKITKNLNKVKPDSIQQNYNNLKSDQKKKKKKPDGSSNQVSHATQNKNLNGTKPKTKTGKGGEKKKKQTAKQWEQWKEKDSQLVDGNYEDDLQEAILLSQLDYEENKDYYDQIKKEQEEGKKVNKKTKKSTRAQPMSLGQFNSLTDAQIELGDVGGGDTHTMNGKSEADPEFFERVKSDAKKAFKAEQAEAKRKAHEPLIDEVITLAQYKDRLEQSDVIKASLMEEVQQLKEELQKVKSRNQKLCELLFKGEMQDMAKLLVTVDKLQKVKDELSTEVSSLHVQLEQERSKVRALTGDNKHSNKKKGVKFDASCETKDSTKDKEKR